MLFNILRKISRSLTKAGILIIVLAGLFHIEEAAAKKRKNAEAPKDAQEAIHLQLNALFRTYEQALNTVQHNAPFQEEIVEFYEKYHPAREEHFDTKRLWKDWIALLREKNNAFPARIAYLGSILEEYPGKGAASSEGTALDTVRKRADAFASRIDELFDRVDLRESKKEGKFFVEESNTEFKQASGRRTRKFLTYGTLGGAAIWVWRNKVWIAKKAARLLWDHRASVKRFFTRSRIGALLMLANVGFAYATCEESTQKCVDNELDEHLKDVSNGRLSLHPPTDESYLTTELISGSCRLNLPELEGLERWKKLYGTKADYWKSRDLHLGTVWGGQNETPLEKVLRRDYSDDEVVEMMAKDPLFEYAMTLGITLCEGKPTQARITTIVNKFKESKKTPPQNEDLLEWFHRNVKDNTLHRKQGKIESSNPKDQLLYWMVTETTTLAWMKQNASFASDVTAYCLQGNDRNLQAKMCTWHDIASFR